MCLKDLAEHVRAQNVEGIGDKVFAFSLEGNDAGAMFSTGSGMRSDADIPRLYKGPLQLVVRGKKPQLVEQQAKAISDLLGHHARMEAGLPVSLSLPTAIMHYMIARHLPLVYSRSNGDFYEASVNFDVCFIAI